MNSLKEKVEAWSKRVSIVKAEAEKVIINGNNAVLKRLTKDSRGFYYGLVSKFKENESGKLVLLTSGVSKAEYYGKSEDLAMAWYNKD